jgi:hypothetical protein
MFYGEDEFFSILWDLRIFWRYNIVYRHCIKLHIPKEIENVKEHEIGKWLKENIKKKYWRFEGGGRREDDPSMRLNYRFRKKSDAIWFRLVWA